MSRFSLATAAAVLAVSILGLALLMNRPTSNTGTSTPKPTPTPSDLSGVLQPGTTYIAADFSQPFTVTVPVASEALKIHGHPNADMLYAPTTLRVSPSIGAITFHDDGKLPKNFCRRSAGVLSDVPATPSDVEEWLRGSQGLVISASTTLAVDGRTAYSWDITLPSGCDREGGEASLIQLNAGEHHRIYAILTGDDTILAITWGQDYNGQGEEQLPEINAWADAFVGAMHFQ